MQFSYKEEMQVKIAQYKERKLSLEKQIIDCRQRIHIVSDIIEPVNERIKQYGEHLQRVVKSMYTLFSNSFTT